MRLTVILLTLMLVPLSAANTQQLNGDVNCSGGVNILDVTYTINYLYKDGPEPCQFISPGVAWVHHDLVTIDVDAFYSTLAWVYIDAPADGYVSIDFSFFVNSEAYCMQYAIGDMVLKTAWSEITAYTTDSPMSWNQIFPIDSGANYYNLSVRGCLRDETADKYNVDFSNVNLSATFIPNYYGSIRK